MLTARRVQRSCSSCRGQLLSLFRYGFVGTEVSGRRLLSTRCASTANTSAVRATTAITSVRSRALVYARLFSASSAVREKSIESNAEFESKVNEAAILDAALQEQQQQQAKDEVEKAEAAVAEVGAEPFSEIEPVEPSKEQIIESFVVRARNTFGETLPKDYLSKEEYALYERLYGPPLRETTHEDVHVNLEEELAGEEVVEKRNVLLRMTDENGAWEEVELEEGMLGSRVVDEEGNELLIEEQEFEEQEIEEFESDELVEGAEWMDTEMPIRDEREREVLSRLRSEMQAAERKAAKKEAAERKALKALQKEEKENEEYDELQELEEHLMEEDMEEEIDEELWESGETVRSHPHTVAGRFGTKPSTLNLPKEEFVVPVSTLLSRTNIKHLTEASHRAFGGVGLPYSASTPQSKKQLQQKHIGLEAGQHSMAEIEADAYMTAVMPGTYAAVMSTLVETRRRMGSSWIREMLLRDGGPRFLDAGAGGGALVAWREVLKAEWEVLRSEGVVGREAKMPLGKSTVLTGSDTLRHRMSRFLEETTFLPRLPDYFHSSGSEKLLDGAPAQGRKFYDVIIAPHTLLPLKEDFRRKVQIQNLWSLLEPEGGVLVLIEKGIPRGFEAIAGARSLLLKTHIASPNESVLEEELQSPTIEETERFREKEKGMIIAPCTNHNKCPMYLIEGTSLGRKDFCHFQQRYIRPTYLQRVLGASSKNHEDVRFSYISLLRGKDSRNHTATNTEEGLIQGDAATTKAFEGYESTGDTRTTSLDAQEEEVSPDEVDENFHPQSLPRQILPPLKRRGHVIMDLCTPSGTIERWTVPRSFSKQAYRDARKSVHGDLWALGAKTRITRNIRLGKEYLEQNGKKGWKKAKGGSLGGDLKKKIEPKEREWHERRKVKKDLVQVDVGEEGYRGMKRAKGKKVDVNERRTKGGRREGKAAKPFTEEDFR